MEKIYIVTDSASDLTLDEIKDYPITLLPLTIIHDGKEFRETFDISKEEFWDILETTKVFPSTAQVTTVNYYDTYKKALSDGYTHIITICINAQGSGTYNSAVQAKKMIVEELPDMENKIAVFDSMIYTYMFGNTVINTAKMVGEGKSYQECLDFIDKDIYSVEAYAATYTLKFARLSGRISGTKAFIGEIMGFKPIFHVCYSKVETVDKARGTAEVYDKLLEGIKKRIVNPTEQTLTLIHGNLPMEDMDLLSKKLIDELGVKGVVKKQLGTAICVNVGPRTLVIEYHGADRRNEKSQ